MIANVDICSVMEMTYTVLFKRLGSNSFSKSTNLSLKNEKQSGMLIKYICHMSTNRFFYSIYNFKNRNRNTQCCISFVYLYKFSHHLKKFNSQTHFGGDHSLAWLTKNQRHVKWTANCSSTVMIVYTLKMFGSGLSLLRTFSG